MPDLTAIRARFPALASDTAFLENAGGSQVPREVAEAVARYMLTSYVQLDADYATSRRATEVVDRAHAFVRRLMGGDGSGEVILGPSCSVLCQRLADCYAGVLRPGDEIVVAETAHEANAGPWVRLAAREPGVALRWWRLDPDTLTCPIEALEDALSERTRLVAFPHVSNLLGEIVDVAAVTEAAHRAGARVVVDGVAYAPHRAMDVAAWDVDFYAYSTYKVYGPHMAALYGRRDALAELTGPNHFFIPAAAVPYKFELGGVCHEGCAGLLALGDYLRFLAGRPPEPDAELDRPTVAGAFDVMQACERPLQERLIEYLKGRPDVCIAGPAHGGATRVGTVSFAHRAKSSQSIARAAAARGIGIRAGHMYAYRLCAALGLDPDDGVVRTSFVHYNAPDEIERLIAVLDEVL